MITAIPLSALLVGFLALTLRTADHAVRTSVSQSLSDAGSVFVELLATRRNELLTMASVTARDPRFFATLSIPEDERSAEFAPTLEGVAGDFLRITDADFIEVFDGHGRLICHESRSTSGDGHGGRLGLAGIEAALRGAPVTDFYLAQDHLVVAGIVPVFVSDRIEAVLRLGSFFDRQFVDEVKRLTSAEVCLTHHGTEIASTYPQTAGHPMPVWDTTGPVHAALGQGSFAMSDAYDGAEQRAIPRRPGARQRFDSADGFDAFLGRDLQAELAPMMGLTQKLAFVGALAILVTLLAAWRVATHHRSPVFDRRSGGELQKAISTRRSQRAAPTKWRSWPRASPRCGNRCTTMEHLRNLDQMKSNFIAVAGHELKTPLTVISGFNEMIVNGMMGEVPEKVQETTQLIQKRLQDLNRLVENILDMSRFEQGLHEFRMAEVDLRELAADAVHRREADLGGRDLRFVLERAAESCRVHADPERLMQAILHLLDNAVRFTPDGGRITVAVRADGARVLLCVRDTGIGIPAAELDWIFDKVYEVGDIMNHSSGRSQFGSRGMGMGLALAKAIVEGHAAARSRCAACRTRAAS